MRFCRASAPTPTPPARLPTPNSSPRRSYRSMMMQTISVGTLLKVLILLHGAIGLPFASPFANAGTNLYKTHTHAHNNPQQKKQPTSSIVSGTATGTTAAASAPQSQKERRPTHLARLKATALSSVQSSSTYDAKQGGEYGSSAISRLLFNYANPIIQKASSRRAKVSFESHCVALCSLCFTSFHSADTVNGLSGNLRSV